MLRVTVSSLGSVTLFGNWSCIELNVELNLSPTEKEAARAQSDSSPSMWHWKFLICYCSGGETIEKSDQYSVFQDVHVMIFIGFGFLMTFLKKYGYTAVGYNMIIASVTIQWAMVVNAWLANAADHHADPGKVKISVKSLITSDFTAGAVLITFGAVLGKTSRLQLLVIAIIEVIFFAMNETILVHYLYVADVGGSMVIHLFGAYFGLGVAFVLRRTETSEEENPKEAATKTTDMFSMLGTIFLWMFWPSFNGAMLGPGDQQHRAIINTYISLAACCVATFTVSPILNKKFKLNMVHVQNATLAGGVAVGALANLQIKPWGAMLIGLLSGIISTLGYEFITPALRDKIKLHDTCGVHNLHGMPGVFAGIAASIAASVADLDDYGNDLFSIYPARAPKNGTAEFASKSLMYTLPSNGKGRSKSVQGGMQLAAMFCSLGISILGGAMTGLVVKYLDSPTKEQLFDDEDYWMLPEEEERAAGPVSGQQIELIMKRNTEAV
eukprot:gene8262-9145_t